MDNDELTTLVREQRPRIPMTTPVNEIIDRGRTIRARRKIPGVAGALVMAVAVVAVATVAAFGHGGSVTASQTKTQLAAWTVTKQANGDVTVTIRQLHDPAGLAAALRADGVPAYVAFAGPVPAYCQAHPAVSRSVYRFQRNALIINPSAIPSGAGLFIMDVPLRGQPLAGLHPIGHRAVHVGLVSGGKQCPLS